MTDTVVYFAHVVKEDAIEFQALIEKHIEECHRCYFTTEIQYQMAMKPSGNSVYSAIVIGRAKQ